MCFYWEDQKEIEADIRASLDTWHLSPVSKICPRHSITLKKKKKSPAVEEIRWKLSRCEQKSMFNILFECF